MSLQTVPASMVDPVTSLGSSSVTTAALAANAVTSAKMATGAAAGNLAAGDVTTSMLAASAVTPAKIAQPLTLSTAQNTTSGTSIDFTSIPSWVKRITLMFSGVSTSGSSPVILQLGKSAGVETTNYLGTSFKSGGNTALSSGFKLENDATAGSGFVRHGMAVLTLLDAATNTWAGMVATGQSDSAAGHLTAGSKALAGTLDRVRLTTVGGSDTFDAGSVNVLYE